MEINTYVKGKSTTGIKFICAKVVDVFNNLVYINIDNRVLKCNIRDLEII